MEFLRDSSVPDYYKEIIGSKCRFCGSDLVVNDTRTLVKCSNPQCPRKIAGSIRTALSTAGIKGYGTTACLSMVAMNRYASMIDFYERPPLELVTDVDCMKSRINRLDDAVRALFIPGFGENATKLFSCYTCMNSFLDSCTTYGTSETEVMSVFGNGQLSQNIFEIVEEQMIDFYRVDDVFALDEEKLSQINYDVDICVTGSVNSEYLRSKHVNISTRDQLVMFLNQQFSKYGYRFALKSSVTSSVSFVVCDSDADSGTTKAKQGRQRGILVTTDMLLASIAKHINENGDKDG